MVTGGTGGPGGAGGAGGSRPGRWTAPVGLLLAGLVLLAGSCSLVVLEFDEATDPAAAVRILHFSDLHFDGPKPLHEELIQAMVRQKPDLIVFTGDVVSHPGHLEALASLLARVPDVPRFAILGNHEYTCQESLADIQAMYQACDFTFLANQSARVTVRGRTVRILGLDDFLHGSPRLELLAEQDLELVLLHEPEAFATLSDTWPGAGRRLFFAGHTHGGQITFFGIPLLLPEGSGEFVAGRYARNKDVLFVSKGVGTTALDLRLFASPDVVVTSF